MEVEMKINKLDTFQQGLASGKKKHVPKFNLVTSGNESLSFHPCCTRKFQLDLRGPEQMLKRPWDDCFVFAAYDHFLFEIVWIMCVFVLRSPLLPAVLPSDMNRLSESMVSRDLVKYCMAFLIIHQKAVFRKASLAEWVVWAVEVCTLVLCILESSFLLTLGVGNAISFLFLWRNLWMRLRT